MKLQKTVIIFLLLMNYSLFSQEKFEREYRIKPSEVPLSIVKIIKKWHFTEKIKWYAEESNDGKTFEAKTCFNKHKYSIEFSVKGAIIDVEKTVKFKELSTDIQQKIKGTLSRNFKKHRIKKIQIQYSGKENDMYVAVFRPQLTSDGLRTKYELVLKGKKEKRFLNYELLLNLDGEIEKQLLIKSSNSINLEF
jgi:hypothetical protein